MEQANLDDLLAESGVLPEVLSHYDGEVQLHYHSPLHVYYTVEDGVKSLVPGVTTVVGILDKSGPLTQWAANKTVEWAAANFPQESGREQLSAMLQRFRDKAPWDDAERSLAVPLACDSYELAKLFNEARFNFRNLKQTAGNIGHVAHEWLEGYIKAIIANETHNRPMPLLDPLLVNHPHEELVKATNCINVALAWFARHGFRPVFSEKKIFSRIYGFAGTLDWLAYITSCGDLKCCPFEGEELVLGDFKSSNSLHDEYRLQVSGAYRHAVEEEFPHLKIGACQVLRLGKEDGDFEVMPIVREEFDSNLEGFLGLLQAYHWQKQLDFNRRYAKDFVKATKKAEKAAADALKPKRVKRAVIREVLIESLGIGVEGEEPVAVAAEPKKRAPRKKKVAEPAVEVITVETAKPTGAEYITHCIAVQEAIEAPKPAAAECVRRSGGITIEGEAA